MELNKIVSRSPWLRQTEMQLALLQESLCLKGEKANVFLEASVKCHAREGKHLGDRPSWAVSPPALTIASMKCSCWRPLSRGIPCPAAVAGLQHGL